MINPPNSGMERSKDADGNAQTCRKFTTTSAVNEQNVGSHLSGADALDPTIGYLAEKWHAACPGNYSRA